MNKYLTIFCLQENLTPMLPKPTEITDDEFICMYYTSCLKNSYGGETDIRRKRSRIGVEHWKEIQSDLMKRGLMMKNGALTTDGKNALGSFPQERKNGLYSRIRNA
jgi:hypothetical protein